MENLGQEHSAKMENLKQEHAARVPGLLRKLSGQPSEAWITALDDL